MRAHNWKINTLAEFYPKGLLGMNTNRGWKIQLCLRYHNDENRFLPWEEIIGTMLHELAHNIRGPHDAQFYKAMSDLNDEYDKIVASGYTGLGFDAIGQRLGGSRIGGTLAGGLVGSGSRAAAVAAAEKRRRLNEMMLPAGGRKLGGTNADKDPTSKAFWEKWHSPGELAALAAEQRAKDQLWCGSAESENASPTSASASEAAATESNTDEKHEGASSDPNMEIASEASSLPLPQAPTTVTKRGAGFTQGRDAIEAAKRRKGQLANTSTPAAAPISIPGNEWSEWSCPACTLVNRPLALQCDCCLTVRPQL
ncbi:hypothetical protein BGX28_004725 [Mortierella sp. GBA30]|nr:hypothetical protein BGX28_004725 [Mortierella sp. GBA30]